MTLYAVESDIEWPPGVQPPEGLPTTPIRAVVDVTDRTYQKCAVEDCARARVSRGWCQMHYKRWWRTGGDPTVTRNRGDVPRMQRIEPFIDKNGPGGCWLWTGHICPAGYARRSAGGSGSPLVHRWLYEQLVGPIAPGLHLDHLCHTRDESCFADTACIHRRCVNPDHLEPVTPAENSRRSRAPSVIASRANSCMRGHSYAEHGYAWIDKQGNRRRYCRTCRRDTYWAARRAARGESA